MKKRDSMKIIVFSLILFTILLLLSFQLIINPLGWIFTFFIYSLWDAFKEGNILIKTISITVFLLLLSAIYNIAEFFYKEITQK